MRTRQEWMEELPKGWQIGFGKELIDDIERLIIKHNYQDEYVVLQIKEKYGSLRWYEGALPEEMYDEHSDIIHYYEKISERTCILCGKRAPYPKTLYDVPICYECHSRRKVERN